ncbi:MAG: UDP-N-acetylglucosamine 2-epimerase (non-hydrolyzing) [Candidatus Altiarchaeota archaeon]
MKIINVVGARPNYMKIAPLIEAMRKRRGISQFLVHTGQHYDNVMSRLFFDDLGLPEPDMFLGVGSGSHAEQTGKIMMMFEKILLKENPDLVLVVGDVNSTVACSLAAAKLGISVAHVEAGLRSFDRSMPEEINRTVTDHLSDYLFTTEESANRNLIREGIPKERIFFVGDVMADTLLKNRKKAGKSRILDRLGLSEKEYAVLTVHRPATVDIRRRFECLIEVLARISERIRIVFPVHPRTGKMMEEFDLGDKLRGMDNIIVTEPLGYLDFLRLMDCSKFVLTDSGGIQGEAAVLGIPCLSLRESTEKYVTIEEGTNVLVGTDKKRIIEETTRILDGKWKNGSIPPLWDGHAAERIVDVLASRIVAKK